MSESGDKVICDQCGVVLLRWKLPGGGFREVLKPVVIAARNPTPRPREDSQIDFCSTKCAHEYVQADYVDPWEPAAVCRALAAYYEPKP